jgi:hypothetical protein
MVEPPPRLTRPQYQPLWQGPFEAWSRQFVAKNHWRVAALCEFDDAVQECAVVFARCAKLYYGKVDNAAWFMALYKAAVVNYFNTLAKKNKKAAESSKTAPPRYADGEAVDWSSGPLLALLNQASVELREVLIVIAAAPSELLTLMLAGSKSDAAAWSRALCRLARTRRVRNDLLFELRNLLE